jgi:hypothetical protein
MAAERALPSPLAHYDPADLLDALATGIVVLDAQLCVIYANVAAQHLPNGTDLRLDYGPFIQATGTGATSLTATATPFVASAYIGQIVVAEETTNAPVWLTHGHGWPAGRLVYAPRRRARVNSYAAGSSHGTRAAEGRGSTPSARPAATAIAPLLRLAITAPPLAMPARTAICPASLTARW